jgi:hypothetical protein
MKLAAFVSSGALMLCLAAPVVRAAQQAPPPPPKPGPAHEVLKMDVGTWDAIVESPAAPGAKPTTTKGVEVNRLGCGGLCLITDFKGEAMPGVPFQGHGVTTWDPAKKKYVGSWTDSMSQGLLIGETTWDPKAKKMSGSMEGPDMTGKITKMRSEVEYAGEGGRVMTAYAPGPDGKEMQVMKITYKRRSK